jgi:IclR family transcriptional regulator, mhp operon transcriptional activator
MEKGVPIRAITRGIAVLQAVNQHGSLTMMEIAQTSRVPYPTACRIVQTLLHEGILEREPGRKTYRATSLVLTLASGYMGQMDDAAVRSTVRQIGSNGRQQIASPQQLRAAGT